MRKIFPLLAAVVFLLGGLQADSQKLIYPNTKNIVRCATVERINELRKANPNAETDEQFENWLTQKTKARKQSPGYRPAANYTIPIIFHVIHNGEAIGTDPNLVAGLIQEELLQLNKDFSNLSNSPYPVAAASGLTFVLAANDPTGIALAEPGIDRIDRNTKGWTDYSTAWTQGYIDGTVKPGSIWDATRYYNVWIVPNFTISIPGVTPLGYSTFPGSSTLQGLNNVESATTAGVVVLTLSVGSVFAPANCNNSYSLGKTLTHETGHFFGLRHIWGDAVCGTDYCDDTPVHFGPNTGVPSHPKSNSCGTPDEMFENYMDYSDDIILNTFTTDQVDRMQTVMLNSPRRVSLATSNVGAVAIRASNQISFINCTGEMSVVETGVNTSYPRFKDISLTLNVEDRATSAATVTITTGGTAVSGRDYQLLTPILVFASGDNFKPVNIRIFDNPQVDVDRTITLSYTITGRGVVAGANAQTLTVTILDDDNLRVGENVINLLDEHFDNPTGTPGLPAGWSSLFSSGYVNKFVASANGNAGGTGPCAHITNDVAAKPNIYTKGISGAAALRSPLIDAGSIASLGNLSFKYTVGGLTGSDDATLYYLPSDGSGNLIFAYGSTPGSNGYGPYSNTSNAPVIPGPSTLKNRKFNLYFYWQTGTDASGVNPGFNVDDIVLAATPYHVETAVSSSYTYDILAGTSVNNFKSGNNNIITTITNTSENISGVTAQITQAGVGNVAFTTTSGNFLRSQKVFQISPLTVNATASYQGKLYFTTAELATWGADRLNLKILKVKDGISLSSVLDASNSEIITPTVFEDAAAGYVTYSGNFTGFSQFMVVSPLATLPVTITSFQATALTKTIQLVWNTSQELNNRGFIVERSLDGVSFKQVGWVNGNGTRATASTYSFTDNYVQPNVIYYYRIRQVDIDNRQLYSAVRNARLKPGAGITINVNPNPAKDNLNLFIVGTTNKASLELVNVLGQKLLQYNEINATDGVYNIPLRGISKGVYTLVIYLPEGAYAKKIMVE